MLMLLHNTLQVPGTGKTKPIKVNLVDGGEDENPRFYGKKMASAVLFMRGGYELFVCVTRAAGWSAYNAVERGQCWLTQALDGCIFESDFYGKARLKTTGAPASEMVSSGCRCF
jgi:hypothetical protein